MEVLPIGMGWSMIVFEAVKPLQIRTYRDTSSIVTQKETNREYGCFSQLPLWHHGRVADRHRGAHRPCRWPLGPSSQPGKEWAEGSRPPAGTACQAGLVSTAVTVLSWSLLRADPCHGNHAVGSLLWSEGSGRRTCGKPHRTTSQITSSKLPLSELPLGLNFDIKGLFSKGLC